MEACTNNILFFTHQSIKQSRKKAIKLLFTLKATIDLNTNKFLFTHQHHEKRVLVGPTKTYDDCLPRIFLF